MDSQLVSLALLVTGIPPESVSKAHGGFADMFTRALDGHAKITPIDVMTLQEGGPYPDLSAFDGVLISGSPSMVEDDTPWIRATMAIIRDLIAEEIPLLGICFGHQLIGNAMGADVGPNAQGYRAGTTLCQRLPGADPLTDHLPPEFSVIITHRDVVRIPGDNLQVLAQAGHDPHHIVRAGKWAWGVQFHPEFNADIIRAYLKLKIEILDAAYGPGSGARALEGVEETPHSRSILTRFATICRKLAAQ